ncbi:MAG: IS1634 family transposase [bacterium]|nr:IS1634 family transposase [bacterium]
MSESNWENGQSTTRNIANLGNIERFSNHDVENLIDGFIKIFSLDTYARCDDVEILESLEHGTIIFWRKFWNELGLGKILHQQRKKHKPHVRIAVERYVEMMVVNRCIRPFSKLRTTSWLDTTSYKVMHGYSQLERDVNYFYRSMDCVIDMKDAVELAIFERLRNLFSVNVKLTFYDITSTFFYTENCPLGEHGYSRDHRRDCEQIVIGVVTSYEGYPLKHYVFKGDTTDVTTVKEVVKNLKQRYHIEDTVFVGDRGMVSKVNIEELEEHGFDCIMGVKMHQNELYQSVILRGELDWKEASLEHRGLKVLEKHVVIKKFLGWKFKRLLMEAQIDISDEQFHPVLEQIKELNNTTVPDFKSFRKLLRACWPDIDSKLCQKIITVLKRYKNHYDDKARFIICLNPERQQADSKKRKIAIETYTTKLDQLFDCGNTKEQETNQQQKKKRTRTETTASSNKPMEHEGRIAKLFEGYRAKYRKFFQFQRDEATQHVTSYRLNQAVIEFEGKFDGVFALLSTRDELEAVTVIDSYKNLQEVETLFDDLKHFVDVHPIRHRLEERVRAHVFVCILALLLKRIFEINYLKSKSVTEPLMEIEKVKLVRYKVKFSQREERHQVIPKVTTITTNQKKYFDMIGLKNPSSIEQFTW